LDKAQRPWYCAISTKGPSQIFVDTLITAIFSEPQTRVIAHQLWQAFENQIPYLVFRAAEIREIESLQEFRDGLQVWDFLSDILNRLLRRNISEESLSNLPVLPPATATATRLEAATTWGFPPDSRIYILYLIPDVRFYLILIFKNLIDI
jgi:hypothetical protein